MKPLLTKRWEDILSNPIEVISSAIKPLANLLDLNFGNNPQNTNPVVSDKSKPSDKLDQNAVINGQSILTEAVKGSLYKSNGLQYNSINIDILSGKYANLHFDMGTNAEEFSVSQSAEWSDSKLSGIRTGGNFSNISPRELNFSVDYYSHNQDISPLVENWAHLHELTSAGTGTNIKAKTKQPPLLLITSGLQRYANAVMKEFSVQYDNPFPLNGGWRHAVVTVSFTVFGGTGSIYQTAPPHAPTPLEFLVSQETEAERVKRGQAGALKTLFSSCVGDEAEDISKIFLEEKYRDPQAFLKLKSPEAFVQAAVSGMMSDPAVRGNDAIKERLKKDLAQVMVRNENGITPDLYTQLTQAVISGDPAGLPDELVSELNADGKSVYDVLKASYDKILKGITEDTLSKDILNKPEEIEAQNRLRKSARCGVEALSGNLTTTTDAGQNDVYNVKAINAFLASNPTDEQIMEAFSIPESGKVSIIRKLKSGAPYSSKEEFLRDASENVLGYSGNSAWNAFSSTTSTKVSSINAFIAKPETDLNAIKQAFGISEDSIANKIKNNGNPHRDINKLIAIFGDVDKAVAAMQTFKVETPPETP